MVIINKNLFFIKRVIYYFDFENKEILNSTNDILCFNGLEEPIVTEFKNEYHKCKTYITKLSPVLDKETYLSSFCTQIRRAVHKSERDNVVYEMRDSKDISNKDINIFSKHANKLYKELGLKSRVNKSLVKIFRKNGNLKLSTTKLNDKYLTFHLYICDNKNTLGWYYISIRMNDDINKNYVGIANRYNHFKDFMYFSNHGFETYDWGGVSSFDSPNGIDLFKYSFPGEKRYFYEQTIYKTRKGLLFAKIREKLH